MTTNTRSTKSRTATWRRKKCYNCSQTWTTLETTDLSKVFSVKDQLGNLKPFSRDKLYISVYESLKHRKTAVSDATALLDTIIFKVLRKNLDSVISSSDILILTADTLERFDSYSAAHYRAYRQST